jgi:hypothetical protein
VRRQVHSHLRAKFRRQTKLVSARTTWVSGASCSCSVRGAAAGAQSPACNIRGSQ